MSRLLRFLFKQWIRLLDALGFVNFMLLIGVLFIIAILLTSCTSYQHEFLADCERVNAETIKCNVCGYEYLADFPIREDKVQIKTSVSYNTGFNCGNLYFFYGGDWDSVNLEKEQAQFLYDCMTGKLEEEWEEDEWYDEYIYYDDTTDTVSSPVRNERLKDGTLIEDAIEQVRVDAKTAKELVEMLRASGWGKAHPTTTTTMDNSSWKELNE